MMLRLRAHLHTVQNEQRLQVHISKDEETNRVLDCKNFDEGSIQVIIAELPCLKGERSQRQKSRPQPVPPRRLTRTAGKRCIFALSFARTCTALVITGCMALAVAPALRMISGISLRRGSWSHGNIFFTEADQVDMFHVFHPPVLAVLSLYCLPLFPPVRLLE